MRPEAYYDCLSILSALSGVDPSPNQQEMHLIAYLSCLMSLYAGKPVSEWGYPFVVAEGRPFASDLDQAASLLISKGHVVPTESGELAISTTGELELQALQKLTLVTRERWHQASCSASMTLPLNSVRAAILNDAQLGPLTRLETSTMLFEDSELAAMHHQFDELREGLGHETQELMVPATLWLAFYDAVVRHRPLESR